MPCATIRVKVAGLYHMFLSAKKLLVIGACLALTLGLLACSKEAGTKSLETSSTAGTPQAAGKPHPRVETVKASTAGFYDDYYAILDADISNDGTAGSVLVLASITQSGTTTTKKIPMTVQRDETQSIRFVFPLQWQGGEWTPTVNVVVP